MPRTQLIQIALSALLSALLPAVGSQTLANPSKRMSHKSQSIKSQLVPTARTAPDTTATIAAQKQTTQDEEMLPKLFNLPVAPRARMHACGEKWQNIKMAGRAADQTWRNFATTCLANIDTTQKSSP